MATTYNIIDKTTLGSSQSSVSFTSIPADYTDLLLRVSARNTSGALGTGVNVALNGTALSTGKILFGDGSSAMSAANSSSLITGGSGTTSNTFSNGDLYIPNYLSSIAKTASGDSTMENNATGSYAVFYANLWSGVTSAVTSITLTLDGGPSFSSGSSFYLYGIKNS